LKKRTKKLLVIEVARTDALLMNQEFFASFFVTAQVVGGTTFVLTVLRQAAALLLRDSFVFFMSSWLNFFLGLRPAWAVTFFSKMKCFADCVAGESRADVATITDLHAASKMPVRMRHQSGAVARRIADNHTAIKPRPRAAGRDIQDKPKVQRAGAREGAKVEPHIQDESGQHFRAQRREAFVDIVLKRARGILTPPIDGYP
jgi:hypothetical protein